MPRRGGGKGVKVTWIRSIKDARDLAEKAYCLGGNLGRWQADELNLNIWFFGTPEKARRFAAFARPRAKYVSIFHPG